MSALIKTGNGKYATPSGTFTAERVRYRDWYGDYRWAYEVCWNRPATLSDCGDWRKRRVWISEPYGGRPVCHTLAEAHAIVARYERAEVEA